MALICNGYRFGHMPHQIQAGILTTMYMGKSFRDNNITGRNRNITAGQAISSDKVGVPMGYLHPASWIMPQKSGNLSSHNNANGSVTCLGTAYWTMRSTITNSCSIYGKIEGVIQGAGTSAGNCTVEANKNALFWGAGSSDGNTTTYGFLNAVLMMDGIINGESTADLTTHALAWIQGLSEGSSDQSGDMIGLFPASGVSNGSCTTSAQKDAIAWCIGQVNGSCVPTLHSYATGRLAGQIFVNQSEATVVQIVDGVLDAQTSEHQDDGTIGKAITAAGTAGDPWTGTMSNYNDDTTFGAFIRKLLTVGKFIGLK